MTEKEVKIKIGSREDNAQLYYDNKSVKLTYNGEEYIANDDVLFVALKKLRLQLEPLNIFILINASRIDVYPSGMQMNMGITSAYINTIAIPGGDIIDIFENCSDHTLISTVDQQEQFHANWLSSL